MVGCFGIAFDDFCLSWIWLEFLRFATLDCVEGVCKTEPYPGVDLFCFHTKCCRLIVWLNCCPCGVDVSCSSCIECLLLRFCSSRIFWAACLT